MSHYLEPGIWMTVDWFSMNVPCSLPPRSVSTLPMGHSTLRTMLSPYLVLLLSCSPALPRSVKYISSEVRLAVLIHPTSSFPWWITRMLQYYACTLSLWTLWVKVVRTTLHCCELLAGKLRSQHMVATCSVHKVALFWHHCWGWINIVALWYMKW